MKNLVIFCLLAMIWEIYLAWRDQGDVILFALHNLESTLFLIAAIYFYSKHKKLT